MRLCNDDTLMTEDVETYFSDECESIVSRPPDKYEVCFVCSGNTCRSPMAEAYYNHRHGNGSRVAISAGIAPHVGDPINPLAAEALDRAGIEPTDENDYLSHEARELDSEIFESCHRICAMTSQIAFLLILNFPLYADKITSLDEDVPDPYGGSLEDYEATLDRIIEQLS